MLRREGLYSSHLTHWRQQRDLGLAPQPARPQAQTGSLLRSGAQAAGRQNGHLTQRLARAELIIDVQKKVSPLLGIPLAAVDSDESNS